MALCMETGWRYCLAPLLWRPAWVAIRPRSADSTVCWWTASKSDKTMWNGEWQIYIKLGRAGRGASWPTSHQQPLVQSCITSWISTSKHSSMLVASLALSNDNASILFQFVCRSFYLSRGNDFSPFPGSFNKRVRRARRRAGLGFLLSSSQQYRRESARTLPAHNFTTSRWPSVLNSLLQYRTKVETLINPSRSERRRGCKIICLPKLDTDCAARPGTRGLMLSQ